MERTVHLDKRVFAGGRICPQKYIKVNDRILYLQDREHFNGLRVLIDREKRQYYCLINQEKCYLKGY